MNLDERLRQALQEYRDDQELMADARQRIYERSTVAIERSDRRVSRRLLAAAAVVCLSLGGVVTLLWLRSEAGDSKLAVTADTLHGRSIPKGWTTVRDPQADVSIAIPPGWRKLAVADGGAPTEILNVGTAAPVRGVTCPVVLEPGASYVSIAEYSEGDPGLAARGPQFNPFSRPTPRPDSFKAEDGREPPILWGEVGCASGESTLQAGVRFSDRGRRFDVQFVLGIGANRDRAVKMLDSFKVLRPGPKLRSVRGEDAEDIRTAFLGWLNAQPRDAVGEYVEDFDALRDTIVLAVASDYVGIFDRTGKVDDVTRVDDQTARVWYHRQGPGPGQSESVVEGRAVKVDGTWKVARETVCGLLSRSGPIKCPS